MTQFFALCAILGGTLFLFQFVLALLGLGGHEDVDGAGGAGGGVDEIHLDHGHESQHSTHGSSWFFGVLTFRAVVAALVFFGLIGLATTSAGFGPGISIPSAAVAGFAAMLLVAAMLRGLSKLRVEGNEHIENAVGLTGTVYLTVPGNKTGVGKVTLTLQNRTAEYQAVTFAEPLTTGSKIVVVDVVGPDTVEVIAAPQYGRMSHA